LSTDRRPGPSFGGGADWYACQHPSLRQGRERLDFLGVVKRRVARDTKPPVCGCHSEGAMKGKRDIYLDDLERTATRRGDDITVVFARLESEGEGDGFLVEEGRFHCAAYGAR